MSEKILPEFELMVRARVESGGNRVGVREERSELAGANDAEALATAGEPRLKVAAE